MGIEPIVVFRKVKLKKVKFYVLYDENDFPILYFETLKKASHVLGYNYHYISVRFSKKEYIELKIGGKLFKLYKFID